MKSFFLYILICTLTLASCKKEEQKDENKLQKESLNILETIQITTTVTGEFMYSDSQAAFNRNGIIHGVIMNYKAEELLERVKKINPDPYASFDVTLNATILEIDNKDLWPQVIEIHEIISVKELTNEESFILKKQE